MADRGDMMNFAPPPPPPPPEDLITGGKETVGSPAETQVRVSVKGAEAFADVIVATSMEFLEGLIPIYGSSSEKGKAIMKALSALGGLFTEDERKLLAQQGAMLLGGMAGMGKPKASPVPPGASPAVPPPPAPPTPPTPPKP